MGGNVELSCDRVDAEMPCARWQRSVVMDVDGVPGASERQERDEMLDEKSELSACGCWRRY